MGRLSRRIREALTRRRKIPEAEPTPSAPPIAPLAAGPELWRNWRGHREDQPYQGGFEAALYSDAHITGQPEQPFGPYQIFNAIGRDPFARPGELGVGLVARVAWHIPIERPADPNGPDRPRKSSTEHWVAVPLADQLACLLSLILGVRIRSGGEIRDFSAEAGSDPAGRPAFFGHQPPTLTAPLGTSVIPDVAGATINVEESDSLLRIFVQLDADTATAVLRAARLYRQALWIADEDCELAWLLMVSAVETAATQWHPKGSDPPMLLADQNPELAELLLREGGQSLLDRASSLMVLNRATAATQSFLLTFATPPPDDARPLDWARFDVSGLKKAVNTIYKYRSNALHSGLPFPAPMLEPPWRGDMSAYAEIPLGLWTQHGTHTTWMAKDLPMLFHTFAGLSRRALLAWWQELTPASP